jgi:phosphoglycerol transferase MdoB-like AlkP superfamily enzyme
MNPSFTRMAALRGAAVVVSLSCFVLAAWMAAWSEPTLPEKLFLLTLMFCIVGSLLFASGRIVFALLVSGGLFALLRSIAMTKLEYLEAPLMPGDFTYFASTSLVETLRHYPHLLSLGAAVCIAIPLILIVAWRVDRNLFRQRGRWSELGLRSIGTLAFAVAFVWCLLPTGPFAPIYHKGLWNNLSDKAYLTNFFIAVHDSDIHLPPMADSATSAAAWSPTLVTAIQEPGVRPDIVQVLEESTFDPQTFTACNSPLCKLRMFQPDARTVGHGLLRTHTFGGGTWAAEFAVLTGMPQDIFGPTGMYAPFVLAPRVTDTLPRLLHQLGYLTVAIYPTEGNFINARNAYAAYGFDQFYDIHDLGLVMWHTSDAQIFAAAKRVYDKVRKPGQPVFLMVLTMEQHGPHDSHPLSSLPAPYNLGPIHDLPAAQAHNLDTYLSRAHDSDVGMSQLEHDFLDRSDPTVLMHFGDHLPSFGGLITGMQRNLPASVKRYRNNLTYYMIKSNRPVPPLPDYPMLDVAHLPGMVLQAAGLPQDSYFSALSALRKACDGTYDDCKATPGLPTYYGWIFGKLHELK